MKIDNDPLMRAYWDIDRRLLILAGVVLAAVSIYAAWAYYLNVELRWG